jgi:hypothetical protein
LRLDAHHRSEAAKLERAIRKGDPPPEPQPNGLDRAAIVTGVATTESILTKPTSEHRKADRRLGEAVAAARREALAVIATLLDRDCGQLRELEEIALTFRANLIKISQIWFSAGDGPIKISEASAQLLSTPPTSTGCVYGIK